MFIYLYKIAEVSQYSFWFCLVLIFYFSFYVDVTEPLLVEVDQIYHLACPASPIFYKYNPVKVLHWDLSVLSYLYCESFDLKHKLSKD